VVRESTMGAASTNYPAISGATEARSKLLKLKPAKNAIGSS
jgi:hypothetical protein